MPELLTVVTGSCGHVGATLVRALLARGRRVRAICREDHRGIEGLAVEPMTADVTNPASLLPAFKGADVVYHLAGRISLSTHDYAPTERTNVQGVKNVLAACRAAGVRRLIHFSSIHAYEQSPYDRFVDESRNLVNSANASLLPYSRTKAAGERLVREATAQGLDTVIFNPTGIIGPWDFKPSHFGEALLSLATGGLPALVDSGFDWTDVRDVAEAAITAEEKSPPGSRYLLSGKWASMSELAEMVEGLTGRRASPVVLPLWFARSTVELLHLYSHLTGRHTPFTPGAIKAMDANRHISHRQAEKDLGYRPRPLMETVADTLRWFQDHGHPVKLLDGPVKKA
jgi:dihydroflavonol-4-reductase